MRQITDQTCEYGLAFTDDGCVRTLASYDPQAYFYTQIIYIALGGVTTIASTVMYCRSIKHESSAFQQHNFLLCCYASLAMVLCGADPKSYGHIIPRPISSFMSDSITAALYSVYILTLGYWAMIICNWAAMDDKPTQLVCLERIAIANVWGFYILYNASLFLSKGFSRTGLTYLHLVWSAVMLTIISTVFLTYGLRVLSRLRSYERKRKLHVSTKITDRVMNYSYDMELPAEEEEEKVPRPSKPENKHSAKIRKILLMTEMLSLTVVAAQIFMAVMHTAKESHELQCANGIRCESIKVSVSYLNFLQAVCVWFVLWTFQVIKKKEVIPEPRTPILG